MVKLSDIAMQKKRFVRLHIECEIPNQDIPDGMEDLIEKETEFRRGLVDMNRVVFAYHSHNKENTLLEMEGGENICVQEPYNQVFKILENL